MQKTKFRIMSDAANLDGEAREPDGQREQDDDATGLE
jgi:hypothetical protein